MNTILASYVSFQRGLNELQFEAASELVWQLDTLEARFSVKSSVGKIEFSYKVQ